MWAKNLSTLISKVTEKLRKFLANTDLECNRGLPMSMNHGQNSITS